MLSLTISLDKVHLNLPDSALAGTVHKISELDDNEVVTELKRIGTMALVQ